MSLEAHIDYTRKEWTTCSIYVEMLDYLKDKDIKNVADIGANVGEVSKLFLENIPTIKKIYAYEPETANFEFLKNRFLSEPRIIPIKKAMRYQAEENLLLHKGSGTGSYSKASKKGPDTYAEHETVKCTTFEEENLGEIDLAKIDIEGSEWNVLTYSSDLKKVKYLQIEFHGWDFEDYSLTFNTKRPEEYNNYFIQKNLPNYRIVRSLEMQYLLELKNDT